MPRNIEIKARVSVSGLDAIRSRAASLASGPSEVVEQVDVFFAVPRGRLKVRQFSDGSGELIAYERPNQLGPKQSVYRRITCQNAPALVEALSSVLPARGTVVKRREVFLVGNTRVHLDQVERLGSFVEIEVVLDAEQSSEHGHQEAQRLLDALDIPRSGLVAGAYVDLLEEPTV
jgi:adenylate cyclase class IV